MKEFVRRKKKEKRRRFFPWANSDLNLNCNNTYQFFQKETMLNVSLLSSILKLHVFLFVTMKYVLWEPEIQFFKQIFILPLMLNSQHLRSWEILCSSGTVDASGVQVSITDQESFLSFY